MKKLYLFTTVTCPKCPAAKKFVADNTLDCHIIEVGEGLEEKALALEYSIRSVPTFVEVNDGVWKHVSMEEIKNEGE